MTDSNSVEKILSHDIVGGEVQDDENLCHVDDSSDESESEQIGFVGDNLFETLEAISQSLYTMVSDEDGEDNDDGSVERSFTDVLSSIDKNLQAQNQYLKIMAKAAAQWIKNSKTDV
jgi:hypothetical protein